MAKMKSIVFKIGGFHLNREVVHAKTIVKFRAQLFQQVRLRDAGGMNHVRAECFASGRDGPNMKIVNVGHALRVEDRIFNRGQIDVSRRAFEQHVRRLFDQPDRAHDYEQTDHDAEQCVRRVPAKKHHANARENRRHRTERVAHDVYPRTAQVEINFVTRVKYPRTNEIDYETADGDDDHRPAANDWRRQTTPVSTIK